ncbi:hypothetical protein [Actinokineospora sp.]|uniref:hypothetical protein n=1 Tax=Actinokineospora sp. TaxID=1872133 RepID=UPI0040384432
MTDADLLAELARLLGRLDPVPADAHAAAVLAGTFLGTRWDWLDLVPMAGAGVRGDACLWRADGVLVEVADRIGGLLTIPVSRAELHSAAGVTVLPVDAVGCFSAAAPPGRLRLVLHREGAAPLVSGWFR